jgi:hypothetical protein
MALGNLGWIYVLLGLLLGPVLLGAYAVVMAWLYKATSGSMLMMVLFHATIDMLPEPTLPGAHFPLLDLGIGDCTSCATLHQVLAAEAGFDHFPPRGIIVIMFRQSPNAMQMLWQQADGVDLEGMGFLHLDEGRSQSFPRQWLEEDRTALVRYHCEKVGSSGDQSSAVSWHAGSKVQIGSSLGIL